MPGTNAKMNEFQALMGMLILRHLDGIIGQSRLINALYRERLEEIPGIKFPPPQPHNVSYNYAYEPVEIIEEEFGMSRDALYEKLKEHNVHCRRYFYPLVCDFSCYRGVSCTDPLSTARSVAERIITLPIYDSLMLNDVNLICDIVINIHNSCQ